MRPASRSSSSTERRIELNSLGGDSRPSRASCPRRPSSPRQSCGDPCPALAAIGGGNPVAAFLLFIPVIGLLLGMRRVSGQTPRLVLLILVIVFANLMIVSVGGMFLIFGIVLVALFVLGFIILELMRDLR